MRGEGPASHASSDTLCSGRRGDDTSPRRQLWARRGCGADSDGALTAGPPCPRALQQRLLTDPLLQAGGGCGFGGRGGLALLQGTALVVHAAALELAQQVEEALLVGGRGPRDALGVGAGSQRRLPQTQLGLLGWGQGEAPPLRPAVPPRPRAPSPTPAHVSRVEATLSQASVILLDLATAPPGKPAPTGRRHPPAAAPCSVPTGHYCAQMQLLQ